MTRYGLWVARLRFLALTVGLTAVAGTARAGEAACHFEAGVVVVPAELAGIAGDYILDTGAARSLLDETRAGAAGFEGEVVTGDVRLAGVTVSARPLKVAGIDLRTWNLPTAVAGVIGADLLKGHVVDISFAPCWVRVFEPGQAPAFRGRELALGWDQGRPTAPAAVSDDAHEIAGAFVVATGANAPLRLADDLAQAPGSPKPAELYPDGVWLSRLPQVSFAGSRGRDVAAGLMKPDGAVAGVLGGQVLAHFRLRFDFPAGRLVVAPAR